MKTKHTAGCWQVFYQKGDFNIPTGVGIPNKIKGGIYWEIVADIIIGAEDDRDYLDNRQSEVEANAKLIATAPEMLEALMKIVHMNDDRCKCPACKIGKPIIKKATQ